MKNKTILLISILTLTLILSSCTTKNTYTMPDLDNLTPEQQKLYDEFEKEILGSQTQEEKIKAEEKSDYVAAIARDIAKKYIMTDSNEYNELELVNRGVFHRNESEVYNRIDLNADDVYVKSILIDTDNHIFKLYNKNEDKIEDFDYIDIGRFVQNLGPWISDDQKLETIDETTPQRVGTSIELYRDINTNELCIAIQTYFGFDNIANVIAKAEMLNDTEFKFDFSDDGFGHSGDGTLKFISPENMLMTINAKTDGNFGIANGAFNLIKNKV